MEDLVRDCEWTAEQGRRYEEDGFIVVDSLISPEFAEVLQARYSALFAGPFETGTNPDNFPVQVEEGALSPITRWMTNPSRSDYRGSRAAVGDRDAPGEPCSACGGAVRMIACNEDGAVHREGPRPPDAKAVEPRARWRPPCHAPPRCGWFDGPG